jgi:hypothetical protein
MGNEDRQRASVELEELRRTRRARVDLLLHDDMLRQAPGNAIYWVAVVIGSFALNLLVLLLVGR